MIPLSQLRRDTRIVISMCECELNDENVCQLLERIGPLHSPFRVPTGLGSDIDQLTSSVAALAAAVRAKSGHDRASFMQAVKDLRDQLQALRAEIETRDSS